MGGGEGHTTVGSRGLKWGGGRGTPQSVEVGGGGTPQSKCHTAVVTSQTETRDVACATVLLTLSLWGEPYPGRISKGKER